MSPVSETKPNINVTPLIDVLLVLLIIFMVISPLKPTRFQVSLPSEREDFPANTVKPNPYTLIVTVGADERLKLNHETNMGTVSDPAALVARLDGIFEQRMQNGAYAEKRMQRDDLSASERIERTVFVKAPRSIKYGEIAKVVDSLKGAGATPISFQLDDLD